VAASCAQAGTLLLRDSANVLRADGVQWGTYLGCSWTDYSALVAASHGVTPYSATGRR